MRACGQKFGVKRRPQIFLAQNLIFFNGSTAFQFPRNPRKSSSTAFQFFQWQVYERSLSKLCISAKIAIFRDKIIGGKNTKDHYPSFVFSAPSFVILTN
jgi:hypothetical protein